MGSIKDRNGMNLTETEDIKKKWQEYTELYKKNLHDQDNVLILGTIQSTFHLSSHVILKTIPQGCI